MKQYTLTQIREGSSEVIEWAKQMSQDELNMMEQEYNASEDPYLWRVMAEIKRIRNNEFISVDELRVLAKKAFLQEDEGAKEKISYYFDYENDDKVTDGASLAYAIYSQNSSGMTLAYAVLAGMDIDGSRIFNEDDELKSPWDYSNYNSDCDVVFSEMIDTLLYEDSQPTRWKKVPHTVLCQLIEEGKTHPGIPAFLEKHKDKKWAQACKKHNKKQNKLDSAKTIGCVAISIPLFVIGAILMIFLAGGFVIGIGSIFGLTKGIEDTSGKDIFITGVCICSIPAVIFIISKLFKKIKDTKRNYMGSHLCNYIASRL